MKYFLKKKWTEELGDKEGYKRWIANYPQYKDISFDNYKRYWKLIIREILESLFKNPFGFDLPLYNGNLSLKRMDKEFKCEKDLPQTPVYDKNLDRMVLTPYPNIENKVVRVIWKKHRNNKKVPDLFAVEMPSTLTKEISKRIKKDGLNKFQMESTNYTYPSRCEDIPLKHPFDLV